MYGPLILLHIGLVLRILIGDAFDVEMAHTIGGVLNVIALLVFVAVAVWSVVSGSRAQSARSNRQSSPKIRQDSSETGADS